METNEIHTVLYRVNSYPIIFTLDPDALSADVIANYPRLINGVVQYSPEFKSLSISSVGSVELTPNIESSGTGGRYQEPISFPVISSPTHGDTSKQSQYIRQRIFERYVLRSPLDMSRYRRTFTDIGIHIITPETTTLGLNPFMAVCNGISSDPLVLHNLVPSSTSASIHKVSSLILRYLFGDPV